VHGQFSGVGPKGEREGLQKALESGSADVAARIRVPVRARCNPRHHSAGFAFQDLGRNETRLQPLGRGVVSGISAAFDLLDRFAGEVALVDCSGRGPLAARPPVRLVGIEAEGAQRLLEQSWCRFQVIVLVRLGRRPCVEVLPS
jgi:hypothetical protein